jgi:predicted nucleotidyltransferase
MVKGGGLADALFSKTQQRLIALLFVNPDRSYFANELVRLAGSGIGAVHRELTSLESAGLVTATRRGNQKHYQANRAAPIFEELRGIALKTFGVSEVLREALHPLASRIVYAFVYGSLAKRTDRAGSDVDLMVVSADIAYADLFSAMAKAEGRLGRKVNPTIYTAAELERKVAAGETFISRVLAQPKIFVLGSEHDLRELAKARKGRAAKG